MSAEPIKPMAPIEIPVLVGPRISLQPFTEDDIPALLTWPNDERTRRWSRQAFPQSQENQKKIVTDADYSTKADRLPFAVWLNDEKRVIGFASLGGIDWANKNCWVGLTIGDKEWWGKGVAGEVGNLLFDQYFSDATMKGNVVKLSLSKNSKGQISLSQVQIYEISNASRRGITVNGGPVVFK